MTPRSAPAKEGAIHLIGIGGVGMSALAQALLDSGRAITGADRMADRGETTPALDALARQGVRIFPESAPAVDRSTAKVVVSTAVEDGNPGLVLARSLSIPVQHRAAALAEVLSGKRLLAVAGTCGKSTVTAMLGHILAKAGFDPLVVNGASVPGWDAGGTRVGSVRNGAGEWAVAEVDESDKSLFSFSPEAAVITNASTDHFALDETEEMFDRFRAGIRGPVVDCRQGGEFTEPETKGWSGSFVLAGRRWTVSAPGLHNIANAASAVRAALAIGAAPDAAAAALETFQGVNRRLEKKGMRGNAAVIDDYAHNPAKLSAMWHTLADAFPQGIAVAWRPHGYGPLRKTASALAGTFLSAIRPQDTLVLLDVYDAGGTADRSFGSAGFLPMLAGAKGRVVPAHSLAEARSILEEAADRGAGALVCAGARDPGLPVLAEELCMRDDRA